MSARTARKTAATTEERGAKVAALRDRLTQWQADADPALIAMALARHDGYSERNAMLIAMQCPEASDVSGFKTWIQRGRCVRRGEHGIAILAPAGTSAGRDGQGHAAGADGEAAGGADGEARKVRQFFRLAYVFDVSQTDPLPEADGDA